MKVDEDHTFTLILGQFVDRRIEEFAHAQIFKVASSVSPRCLIVWLTHQSSIFSSIHEKLVANNRTKPCSGLTVELQSSAHECLKSLHHGLLNDIFGQIRVGPCIAECERIQARKDSRQKGFEVLSGSGFGWAKIRLGDRNFEHVEDGMRQSTEPFPKFKLESLSLQSAEYARMYELEDRYWWFVARRDLALQFLSQVVPPNADILDVGCGTGKGQESFGVFGTVFGVDFSQDALQFCHQRGLERIARANAEKLPIQSNRFDTVVTLDTIEHVPDDQAAISEIFRVLKPGGHLLINVPAYQWLWGPHDVALMHQRRYSRTQVKKLLESNGFVVERLTYHIFFLFPLVALSRFMSKFKKGEPDAKLPPLPKFVESIFNIVQRGEAAILVRSNLPWGSSIVALARKP